MDYSDMMKIMGTASQVEGARNTQIVFFILALAAALCTYFLFINPAKKKSYTGAAKWLHEFLDFKKSLLEAILKISYIFFAVYITLTAISFITTDATLFFATLIVGNVMLRVAYEAAMLLITIAKNTTEINNKMKNNAPAEKKAEAKKEKEEE